MDHRGGRGYPLRGLEAEGPDSRSAKPALHFLYNTIWDNAALIFKRFCLRNRMRMLRVRNYWIRKRIGLLVVLLFVVFHLGVDCPDVFL